MIQIVLTFKKMDPPAFIQKNNLMVEIVAGLREVINKMAVVSLR